MENDNYKINKKKLLIWILIYIISAAVVYGIVYYFINIGKYNQNISQQNQTITNSANTVYVNISNFAFDPSVLTIKKGATVIWKNNDAMPHTVTGDKEGPISPKLNKGDTYSDTFTVAGTIFYHCSIHSTMKGEIIVTD